MNLDDLVRGWVRNLRASAGTAAKAVPPIAAYQQLRKPAPPQVRQTVARAAKTAMPALRFKPQADFARLGQTMQRVKIPVPPEKPTGILGRPVMGMGPQALRGAGGLLESMIQSYGKTMEEAATPAGRREVWESAKRVAKKPFQLKTLEEPAFRWALDVPDVLPGGFLMAPLMAGGVKIVGKEALEKVAKEGGEKIARESGEKILKRIDDLIDVARKRMAKADQASQGLKPAEIDWLTRKERGLLEELKQQLPKTSQAEAAERVAAKRAELGVGAKEAVEKAPKVKTFMDSAVGKIKPPQSKNRFYIKELDKVVTPQEFIKLGGKISSGGLGTTFSYEGKLVSKIPIDEAWGGLKPAKEWLSELENTIAYFRKSGTEIPDVFKRQYKELKRAIGLAGEPKVRIKAPEVPEDVLSAIEQEMRGEAQQGRWGDYLPTIKKMVNFLRIGGEKVSKETKMLFREHIPRSMFGISTDEIASSMRMSENELMEEMVAMAGLVGGDVAKVKKLITKQTPLGRATRQAIIKLPRKISIPVAKGQKILDLGDLKEMATKITKAGREVLIERGGQTVSAGLVEGAENLKDIGHTRMGFGDFYRNVERVFKKTPEAAQKQIIEPFNLAKKQYTDFQKGWLGRLNDEVVQKLGIKKGSKESALVQMFGEKDINIGDLQHQAPKTWKNISEAEGWFRKAYNELLDTVNKTRVAMNKDPIPKRVDYYRHFWELSGIKGIVNIFEGQANIDPRLAGVSDYTQPTSKWLSFAQRRLGFETEKDAVGGFLNYIKPAAYATHIDPQIGKMRAFREALAEKTKDTKNLNNFIEFLNDFANDLAGKTNPADRMLQKWIPGGRKTFKLINAINNRIKANVILGNVRSSFSQIFNLPQGIASAGPKNALAGAYETVSSIMTGEDFALSKSPFLRERYIYKLYDKFDVSLLNKPKKFAQWMTSILDEFGTRTTWLAHFRKGITDGLSEVDAIKYADGLARKLVAGRGVGEVPLAYKSSIVNLIAPFQLEVGNSWLVLKDFIDEKAFKKIATLFVANWMFNEVAERLHGDRIVFDPIDVAMDNIFGEDKDKPLGTKLARFGGEALSNIPFGQQVATMWPERKTEIAGREIPGREELFGRRDPTRYGTGILLKKGIQDPLFKLLPPFGGGQVKKTLGGIKLISGGGEYGKTKEGEPKLKFPAPEGLLDKARALIFGKWATPEARKYFKGGTIPLGAKQTSSFQTLVAQGLSPKMLWQQILDKREDNKATAKATDVVIASGEMPLPEDFETLTDLYKKYLTVSKSREDSLKLLPYESFETDIDRETRQRDLKEELGWAQQIVDRIRKEEPAQLFKIELDVYASGGGRKTEERAEWAADKIGKVRTEEEFNKVVQLMLTSGVLTKSVAEALRDTYGLPIRWYVSGGKIKTLGATGGTGTKPPKPTMGGVTLRAPTVPKVRVTSPMVQFKAPAEFTKPTRRAKFKIVPLKGGG